MNKERDMSRRRFTLPLQFTDDPNGAALDAQDYYGPSMSAITRDPAKSRWADAQGPLVLARIAWESGWDAAIAEVKRRAEVKAP